MKKFLIILFSLFLVVCFVGCSPVEGNPDEPGKDDPPSGQTPEQPGNPDNPDNPDLPGDPDTNKDSFIVTLTVGGSIYIPNISMEARWTAVNGSKVFTAPFDLSGKAKISGLDGAYHVTLTTLPMGYTYDPNIYTADNAHKETKIELISCLNVNVIGNEPSLDNAMTLTIGCNYRATFKSAEDCVWFFLSPCLFETLCDIYADNVLPKLKGYIANAGSGYYNPDSEVIVYGNGPSGNFTENFKFTFEDELASCNFFIMQAESRSGTYPISVDFKLTKYDSGEPGPGGSVSTPEADKTLLKNVRPQGSFRYNYLDIQNHLLQGSRFKLFYRGTTDSTGAEGDGYYHLYNAETNTYGAILFAKLTQNCEILDIPLTDSQLSFRINGVDYSNMLSEYEQYCNIDGAHPVTEELQQMLQAFAVQGAYFDDGNGWAEIKGLNSSEEDQWLFCCGYYR